MGFFRRMLQKLLHRPSPGSSQVELLANPEEAKKLGYKETPYGLQWSTDRQPVDKSRWKSCDACGALIPVVEDYATQKVEASVSNQDDTEESKARCTVELTGTWTYVCPFCGHCHVGTPDESPNLQAQTSCHECGTELSSSYHCPKCSFPRGWMTVQCPYCGNRQPVLASHWVIGCDMFTLECVQCESVFYSLCIC